MKENKTNQSRDRKKENRIERFIPITDRQVSGDQNQLKLDTINNPKAISSRIPSMIKKSWNWLQNTSPTSHRKKFWDLKINFKVDNPEMLQLHNI